MSMAIPLVPIYPAHPNACDYGHLFLFVPGDTGNPFVAVWQADIVQAIVLLIAGLVVLWLTQWRQQHGIRRFFGWIYIAGASVSAILAGFTYALSTPLVCGGASGASFSSNAEQQSYQTFQTLNTLSTLMLYLTLLLLGVFVAFIIILAVSRIVHKGLRTGDTPA